jgi:hypothetical protein
MLPSLGTGENDGLAVESLKAITEMNATLTNNTDYRFYPQFI